MKTLLFRIRFFGLFLLLSMGAGAQELEWVNSIGAEAFDEGKRVITDSEGNSYVTGTFRNTADFNNRRGVDTLRSYGQTDIFLAKYDSSGKYLWSINMGGTGYDYGTGVALDAEGNIYVTGYFFGKATFDPLRRDTLTAGPGFNDIFIAKYNPEGQYKWAINMGGTGQNYGSGIAIASSGEIYITGAFSGKTDFNPSISIADTAFLTAYPGGIFNPNLGLDVFVAKYDTAGRYLWAKRIGSEGNGDYGYDIAVDATGNCYVTGYFAAWADFDPGAAAAILSVKGINDGFVLKLDKDGQYLWSKGIGSDLDDNGLGIALDDNSNVYVTGYFSNTCYLYDTSSTPGVYSYSDSMLSAGEYDAFIIKYDSAGNYQWNKTIGGADGDEVGYAIRIGRGSMISVTGFFDKQAISSDGDTVKSPTGTRDVFIGKFHPEGLYNWMGSVGGDQWDIGYGISTDPAGNLFISGYYTGLADLEPGAGQTSFLSAGSADIFLMKLRCSDTSSGSVQLKECGREYTFNGVRYTASGVYRQNLTNIAGCDSMLTINLELIILDPAIQADGYTLSTTRSFSSYQWLKAGAVIDGATDSAYVVTENGVYQVIVTDDNGCVDTSALYEVTNVGILESERVFD